MNIEIISGSSRENSTSLRVATHLQNRIAAQNKHNVGLLDMRHIVISPVESVYPSVEHIPDELKEVGKRMFGANAFILVSPEYNGSYSASLKNLMDHFPKQQHKAFGIVTASPGALGGIRASQQLLALSSALFGVPSPHLLIVPHIDKKFSEQGELLDPAFDKNIHQFITEFLWLSERLYDKK